MHLSSKQIFLQHVGQTSNFSLALEIEKAEGIYFYTKDGQRYTDLISGISVSNVGHRHPKVVKAIKEQLDKYMYIMVYGETIQSPQNQLALKIAQNTPKPLDNVFFVNSGTEAIEGAMKLAKRYTGRYEIISCHDSYHGSTHGALSVCGNEMLKSGYRPLVPTVKHINYNSLPDLEEITTETAAVIIETVQGEAGIIPPIEEYLKAVRKKCTDVGALMILDEIQAGFGRTGKLWAFEHYNIVPDIFCIAKGMGGGMPIGALVSSKEMMSVFCENPILGNINTFGGHAVCCASALASLNVLLEEELIEQVETKANIIKRLLSQSQAVIDIRNKGLMMAIKLQSADIREQVILKLLEKGIFVDWFLYCDDSFRIAPPLIITEEQIKESCHIILEVLKEIAF